MSDSTEKRNKFDFVKGDEISIGWQKMKENFLGFLLIVILLSFIDIPLELTQLNIENDFAKIFVSIIGVAYAFFLSPVIEYGGDLIFVKGIRNEKFEIQELFVGFNKYVIIVLTNLLVFGLVGIAMVALIVPGIYVACRLAFTSYLVMDKDLQPMEAIETSWKLTRGKAGRIFVMGLSAFFIGIAGLICFIVGILPAIMWVKSYFAVYYQMALDEQPEDFLK